jgi:isopropylmalate/homocitrate/citramalate synthase
VLGGTNKLENCVGFPGCYLSRQPPRSREKTSFSSPKMMTSRFSTALLSTDSTWGHIIDTFISTTAAVRTSIKCNKHKIQAMHVKCNNKARSRNYCCRGKAIRISHCECVSVALVIQYANPMEFVACVALK